MHSNHRLCPSSPSPYLYSSARVMHFCFVNFNAYFYGVLSDGPVSCRYSERVIGDREKGKTGFTREIYFSLISQFVSFFFSFKRMKLAIKIRKKRRKS